MGFHLTCFLQISKKKKKCKITCKVHAHSFIHTYSYRCRCRPPPTSIYFHFIHFIYFLFCFFLCTTDANVYDIDFTRFKIRDLESGAVLFEIAKPPSEQIPESVVDETNLVNADAKSQEDLTNIDSNAGRYVRYQFTPHFLKLKTVGATWVHTDGSSFILCPSTLCTFELINVFICSFIQFLPFIRL